MLVFVYLVRFLSLEVDFYVSQSLLAVIFIFKKFLCVEVGIFDGLSVCVCVQILQHSHSHLPGPHMIVSL